MGFVFSFVCLIDSMIHIFVTFMENLYYKLSTWNGANDRNKHDHTGSYSMMFSGVVLSLFGFSKIVKFY